MNTSPLFAVLALFPVACGAPRPAAPAGSAPPPAAWSGEIRSWGTLREALRDGADGPRVALASVAREGVYGVGALAGLAGEVTVVDGSVWVSVGDAETPRTFHARGHAEGKDAQATVLFVTDVWEWRAVPVTEEVDASELDAFVERQARAAGLDVARPFPFLVKGDLRHLRLHVIAGACPIRARMLGREPEPAPYEAHLDASPGLLVGIYASDSAGVLCHMGSRSHVHVLLDAGSGLTAHVETVGLAAGATLELPAG